MSAVSRLASVSVAAAIGLVTPIVAAPPSIADPCAQTLPAPGPNAAVPPNTAVPRATGPVEHIPTGRKPAGAQDQAPLPEVGPLPPDPSAASSTSSAPWENQAAVIPGPTPPGTSDQPGSNPINRGPDAVAQGPAPAAQVPVAAGATAVPSTSLVGWIDGPANGRANSPNDTFNRFAISGADLGIMWDNGDPNNDQTLLAFGDTFGDCSIRGQQWRSNTLLRSADRTLTDRLYMPDPVPDTGAGTNSGGSPVIQNPNIPGKYNFSKQIIASLGIAPDRGDDHPYRRHLRREHPIHQLHVHQAVGSTGSMDHQLLGAGGFQRQRTDVERRPFDRPQAFRRKPEFSAGSLRPTGRWLPLFVRHPVRTGRGGLRRTRPGSAQDLTKYQYWGKQWWNFFGAASWHTNKPSTARAVIPAPVSEMSVEYNTYLKKFVAMYCDGSNNVVMRTAPAAQGPWSSAQTLVTSRQIPGGIYAPFMHPWTTGKDLYFNLSLWSAYSVMLMHTVLP